MPGHARAHGDAALIVLVLALLGGCAPGDADSGARHTGDTSDTSDTSSDWTGPCPPGMVQLDALCVDAVEATITGDLGNADQGTAWPDGSTEAVAAPVLGEVPTVYVSWYQAVAACENAGKHLCTVAEWQAACSAGTLFPWGDSPEPAEVCAVPAADGSTAWDTLQPAGSLPDCKRAEGVYDQLGNAWEWADPEQSGEDGRPLTAKLGGAYYAGAGNALCPAPPVTEHPPEFDGTIGVRCCVEAR